MSQERAIFGATGAATLLAAAAFLPNGNALAAAATLAMGAAWLAAWRRGSDALVHLGLAGVLGAAAIGGAWGAAVPAVLSAAAALLAWDAMRAERRRRPFTRIVDRDIHETRDPAAQPEPLPAMRAHTRTIAYAAALGAFAGLAALLLRAGVPAGATSFGALAALIIVSVALVAAAIRFTSQP